MTGNTAPTGPEIVGYAESTVIADNHNLFGVDGTAGVEGFRPGATDIVPPAGVLLPDILDPTLADHGGPTLTHALVPGSPARNAGPRHCRDAQGQPLRQDQRGVLRPQEGRCDIGAVEFLPVVFCHGRRATLVGSAAADVLVGTAGDDVIHGRGGDDLLSGRGATTCSAAAGRGAGRTSSRAARGMTSWRAGRAKIPVTAAGARIRMLADVRCCTTSPSPPGDAPAPETGDWAPVRARSGRQESDTRGLPPGGRGGGRGHGPARADAVPVRCRSLWGAAARSRNRAAPGGHRGRADPRRGV